MKRSRFTDQQIAFALQQAEQGTAVGEVTRKMGISEQTLLLLEEEVWGLDALGGEEAPAAGGGECPPAPAGGGSLPGQGDAPGGHPKKALRPAHRRETVEFLRTCYQVSIRRATQSLSAPGRPSTTAPVNLSRPP